MKNLLLSVLVHLGRECCFQHGRRVRHRRAKLLCSKAAIWYTGKERKWQQVT